MFLEFGPKRHETPSALWPALDNTCFTESLHVVAQRRFRHRRSKVGLKVLLAVGENRDDAEANGIAKSREGAFQGYLA